MLTEREILDLLSDYLDDRLDAETRRAVDEGLDRHPEARSELRRLARTVRIVSALPRVEAPAGMAAFIAAEARRRTALQSGVRLLQSEKDRTIRLRWVRRVLPVAAVLAVGCLVGLATWRAQQKQGRSAGGDAAAAGAPASRPVAEERFRDQDSDDPAGNGVAWGERRKNRAGFAAPAGNAYHGPADGKEPQSDKYDGKESKLAAASDPGAAPGPVGVDGLNKAAEARAGDHLAKSNYLNGGQPYQRFGRRDGQQQGAGWSLRNLQTTPGHRNKDLADGGLGSAGGSSGPLTGAAGGPGGVGHVGGGIGAGTGPATAGASGSTGGAGGGAGTAGNVAADEARRLREAEQARLAQVVASANAPGGKSPGTAPAIAAALPKTAAPGTGGPDADRRVAAHLTPVDAVYKSLEKAESCVEMVVVRGEPRRLEAQLRNVLEPLVRRGLVEWASKPGAAGRSVLPTFTLTTDDPAVVEEVFAAVAAAGDAGSVELAPSEEYARLQSLLDARITGRTAAVFADVKPDAGSVEQQAGPRPDEPAPGKPRNNPKPGADGGREVDKTDAPVPAPSPRPVPTPAPSGPGTSAPGSGGVRDTDPRPPQTRAPEPAPAADPGSGGSRPADPKSGAPRSGGDPVAVGDAAPSGNPPKVQPAKKRPSAVAVVQVRPDGTSGHAPTAPLDPDAGRFGNAAPGAVDPRGEVKAGNAVLHDRVAGDPDLREDVEAAVLKRWEGRQSAAAKSGRTPPVAPADPAVPPHPVAPPPPAGPGAPGAVEGAAKPPVAAGPTPGEDADQVNGSGRHVERGAVRQATSTVRQAAVVTAQLRKQLAILRLESELASAVPPPSANAAPEPAAVPLGDDGKVKPGTDKAGTGKSGAGANGPPGTGPSDANGAAAPGNTGTVGTTATTKGGFRKVPDSEAGNRPDSGGVRNDATAAGPEAAKSATAPRKITIVVTLQPAPAPR